MHETAGHFEYPHMSTGRLMYLISLMFEQCDPAPATRTNEVLADAATLSSEFAHLRHEHGDG